MKVELCSQVFDAKVENAITVGMCGTSGPLEVT